MKKSSVNRSNNGLRTAREWHLYYVFSDPEFEVDYQKITILMLENPENTLAIDNLLSKYQISVDDLAYYSSSRNYDNIPKSPVRKIGVDTDKNLITITFSSKMAYRDYVNSWREISSYLRVFGNKNPQKRKPPENPQLIYAVFKARQSGKTFNQIFRLYEKEKLPYYTHKQPTLITEEALERYYNRYKPENETLNSNH